MKRSILSRGKILPLTLLMLVFSIVMVVPIPVVTRPDPRVTIYLDPPTINGTVIGQEFNVSIMIRDAPLISTWAAGMIFNATLLQCTAFKEGEFLSDVGPTLWQPGAIDNTKGVITYYACSLTGGLRASGDGRLAYLTFKVKAPGVSDLHLQDVLAIRGTVEVIVNVIDVYTVVVDAIPHTVVTVSNSTGLDSGFSHHSFNLTLKELSSKVKTAYIKNKREAGFSNVTIPKTLLKADLPNVWTVIVNGTALGAEEIKKSENGTHTSIYFTYTAGITDVQITTRFMVSNISISLSSASITLGSNVTISGDIDPLRPDVTVAIEHRLSGVETWASLVNVTTDLSSHYDYTWKPEAVGTYELKASWEGDDLTKGDESDPPYPTLTVGGIPGRKWLFPVGNFTVVVESNYTVHEETFAFNETLEEISFDVTRPYAYDYFCNVTIPKEVLWTSDPDFWAVIIDGVQLSTEERTVTPNDNTSIYFMYGEGLHKIRITTRLIPSNISISLSSASITLGSNVTISGDIDPLRPDVTVTILYRPVGGNWAFLAYAATDSNSHYNYTWKPEAVGTYELKAKWEGDEDTLRDESNPPYPTLTVEAMPAGKWLFTVEGFTVVVESNSTVHEETFAFNETLEEISFNVTGQYVYMYFCNVTIPKEVLSLDPLQVWAVLVNGRRLSVEETIITENATHTFVYLTYGQGVYKIQITTRFMVSTISIALTEESISLGESVTVSGVIDPVRPDVNVTILYRPVGGNWAFLAYAATDSNSHYNYTWKPEAVGTYELKGSWEGDPLTEGAESDVKTLTIRGILGTIYSFEVEWEDQVFTVIVESNYTVHEETFAFNQPTKEICFNVTRPYVYDYFCNVTIPKELLDGVFSVYIDGEWRKSTTIWNETHVFVYFTYGHGTHRVEVKGQYVIKEGSTISITLSSANITLGENVTISGDIDPVRSDVTVAIEYRLVGAETWISLANVTTDLSSHYNYTWKPETTGAYEVKASWEGDPLTEGAESDLPYPSLTVEEAPKEAEGISPTVVIAIVVPIIIIIAAIVVYFIKFRKPG